MRSRTLFDGVIDTDYGQLDLIWAEEGGFDGDWDRFFAGQENGLVGAADPTGVYLNLARRSGGSPVQIVVHADAPALRSHYQDVVEVSVTVTGPVRWVTWAGQVYGDVPGIDPGSYRLRVSARDRDVGAAGEFADNPVDFYVLDLWPSPQQDDEIVRIGSDDGRHWHNEVGYRRSDPRPRST